MKRPFLLIAVIILLALIIACERKTEISPSGIKLRIGVIAPLTGENRANGESGLDGIKVAMQVKSHLDNGDEIEMVVEDDQSDPALALKALTKLATVDKVSAILVLSPSETVLSIAKVADQYQIPILSTIATNPEITKFSNFVNQLAFDDTFQSLAAALYVRDELLLDRVAVFSRADNPHYKHLSIEFINKFQSVGGTITDHIHVTESTNNYAEILRDARNKNPTLLYVPVEANIILQISKYLNAMNWNPIIMGSDGLLAQVLTKHSDKIHLVEGIIATDLFYDDMKLTLYGKKLKKVVLEENTDVNTNTMIGMEGYGILLDAMNRCDPPITNECINKKLRSTKQFEGIMGFVSMDSNGKAHRPLVINSIEDGELKFIVKVY